MTEALWGVVILSSIALIGVFIKMKDGFGPFNLKILGIVLIGGLMAILAVNDEHAISAAMGVYGAIAGYLFGIKEAK